MIFLITYLRFKLLHQLEPKRHFKIALRPSSIPAKVSNFRNFSVSGKERARERKVAGHDFRKRKQLRCRAILHGQYSQFKSFLPRKDSLATCKAAK